MLATQGLNKYLLKVQNKQKAENLEVLNPGLVFFLHILDNGVWEWLVACLLFVYLVCAI